MKTVNQKGFSVIGIFVLAAALALVGFAVWQIVKTNERVVETSENAQDTSETIVSSGNEAAQPVPPEGWTSYENKKLGFSFDHPENWAVNTEVFVDSIVYDIVNITSDDFIGVDSVTHRTPDTQTGARIGISSNDDTQSTSIVDSFLAPDFDSSAYFNPEEATVAGIRAVKVMYSNEGKEDLRYLFEHDGKEYTITYGSINNPDYQKYTETFEEILSSFGFN